MKRRRALASLIAVLGALIVSPAIAGAGQSDVRKCAVVDSQGYCVEWDVPTPGGPAQNRTVSSRSSGEVYCYWVTIPGDLGEDPTIWFDFGLSRPPAGVTVAWQTRTCSDGTTPYEFRWVIPATPANLATLAHGQLIGELQQPIVRSSPPAGTASIVGVPVFVEVTNWTGVLTQSQCAGGLCVTVTATPAVSFAPGETGSSPIACAGSGSRYTPNGGSVDAQASVEGACVYRYRLRTGASGRPTTWAGSVSVTWTISWTSSAGGSGSLPAVTRSTALPRGVEEVQTVVLGR